MAAVGAIARIAGPNGTRDIPVEDVPTAPGKTSLEKASLLSPSSSRRPTTQATSTFAIPDGDGYRRRWLRRMLDAR